MEDKFNQRKKDGGRVAKSRSPCW